MTHAEALAGNLAGLSPSSCPGELIPRGRYIDRQYPAGQRPRDRTVEVLRCVACGTWIPMADGVPLNAYTTTPRPPEVGGMLVELAGAMDGRGPAQDAEGS